MSIKHVIGCITVSVRPISIRTLYTGFVRNPISASEISNCSSLSKMVYSLFVTFAITIFRTISCALADLGLCTHGARRLAFFLFMMYIATFYPVSPRLSQPLLLLVRSSTIPFWVAILFYEGIYLGPLRIYFFSDERSGDTLLSFPSVLYLCVVHD